MMKSDELVPRARNFFRPDDYFDLNVRNGVNRTPTGTRIVTLPGELIVGLHRGLEDETGSAAPLILYEVGKWWGAQFIEKHGAEVRRFYDTEPGAMPVGFYLQVLKRVWAIYGWGALDMSFEHREKGFILAGVDSPLYSDVVGNIGRTADHLVAGILASVVGSLAGRELECTEIACKSRGDQRCLFLVGMQSRMDVVGNWVKQNRAANEILEAIGRGDLD